MLVQTSRWLKKVLYGALITLFVYMGAYAALYRISDYATLQQQAKTYFSDSQRQFRFDNNIERSLLPRPTISLKNVILTETDGQTPAIKIEELRIGIAWQSLWNQRTIEKLVIEKLSGTFIRHEQGQWNIHDLWDKQQAQSEAWLFNRIIINNGQVQLKTPSQVIELNNIHYTGQHNHTNQFTYNITAQSRHPQWQQLFIRAQGTAILEPQKLSLPDVNIQFNGKENGYLFSGSLHTQALWQPNYFSAQNSKIDFNSQRLHSHLNSTIEQIQSQAGELNLSAINSVYSFKHLHTNYAGAFNSPQIQSHQHTFSGNLNFTLTGDNKNTHHKSDILIQSKGSWHTVDGLHLSQLNITTSQTTANNQTRFASEWEGEMRLNNSQNWYVQLQGLFDRQPSLITLNRIENNIQGSLSFNKLDLSNYISHESTKNIRYPNWPDKDLSLDLAVVLGTLKLPNLEINNLNSQIQANANSIRLNPLSGELYGGSMSGQLSLENTLPPTIHLQQNSQNVHIQPLLQDLFGLSRINGKGQAQLNLYSQGQNRQELIANLSGSLKLNVQNGQWLGINFAELFKSAFGNETSNENPQQTHTPFKYFTLHSHIQQGISQHHIQAQLNQPPALVHSEGQTNFNTGQLHDDLIIHTTGAPDLPIRLSGKLNNPSISLNYQRLTEGSQTPEDKHKIISNTLKQQWQWLKQNRQPESQ